MKRYRKRPVVIEAVVWDGSNVEEIKDFCGVYSLFEYPNITKDDDTSTCAELYIYTLEGTHHAAIGDYIIKGVIGEFYPCKPDIFESTYVLESE